MPSFIIYAAATGVISGSYSVSHTADINSIMAANTPTGASVLVVDGSHPVVTNQKGWQVQDGVLAELIPTDAELLASAKTTQLATLTTSYSAAKTANVSYMSTAFMADEESQQIFAHALVAYTALGATPADFYAVDASYNKVPMTLAQLQGLIAAIAAQVWAAFQRWVTVKEALAAATTVIAAHAVAW